jgi:hypothetical protein
MNGRVLSSPDSPAIGAVARIAPTRADYDGPSN